MGLLPYGKPTPIDVKGYFNFARKFYRQVRTALEVVMDSDTTKHENNIDD